MSDLLNQISPVEWRKFINPTWLMDGVLQSFRALIEPSLRRYASTEQSAVTRPLYSVLTINASDMVRVSVAATGTLIADGSTPVVANQSFTPEEFSDRADMWRVNIQNRYVDIVGCGYSTNIGLRGVDFFYADGYYWFKQHPSYYGTSFSDSSGSGVHLFICGGDYVSTYEPFDVVHRKCTNETVRTAIDSSVGGQSPLGISHRLQDAVLGAKLSTDVLTGVWVENDYNVALTDRNEIIYAPTALPLKFVAGQRLDLSGISTVDDIFVVTVDSVEYPVIIGLNLASDYPGIFSKYPTLHTIAGGYFVGEELLQLMAVNNCNFRILGYINGAPVTLPASQEQRLLTQYLQKSEQQITLNIIEVQETLNLGVSVEVCSECVVVTDALPMLDSVRVLNFL